MLYITLNQEVYQNTDYIVCEEGNYEENDFVFCKNKLDSIEGTVMFLANQIIKPDESSS